MSAAAIFHTPKGDLAAGHVPRVVGTISTSLDPAPAEVPSDLIELRIDLIGNDDTWLARAAKLRSAGIPVIGTIRMSSEGGKWVGNDEQRLWAYRDALPHVSAIDVELRADIARGLAQEAKGLGKVAIVSFHDFQKTPRASELEWTVRQAERFASIVKITTMVNTAEDLTALESLLKRPWDVPICVMGMGPMGSQTRVDFPQKGSCLTYGWLDSANAPGQLSAAELVKELTARIPAYAAGRRSKSL
jgi:3-dehydroquinate dehydratase-1